MDGASHSCRARQIIYRLFPRSLLQAILLRESNL
jgi:hypothetical protein